MTLDNGWPSSVHDRAQSYFLKAQQRPEVSAAEVDFWLQQRRRTVQDGLTRRGRQAQTELDFFDNIDKYKIDSEDNLFVVNKPSGVLTEASPNNPLGVQEIISYQLGRPFYAVHRLDRDTSGVLVLTHNEGTFIEITEQLIEKRGNGIKKIYMALLDGELRSTGSIPVHLDLEPAQGDKMRVASGKKKSSFAKPSETYFTPIMYLNSETGDKRTLARVEIVTGITHQIRVSAEHLGHPVSGDPLYGPKSRTAPRLMLHSYQMRLPKKREFTAPVPDDFNSFVLSNAWTHTTP